MSDDVPRQLATKMDRLLTLVAAGEISPDPLELLGIAMVLEQHGELLRAERCRALAARMLPNLRHGGRA